jgi:hypothetical protein
MTIALCVFILIGLGAVGLLAVAVRRALPAIADLRRAMEDGRQPIAYRFKLAEPVRVAQPVFLRHAPARKAARAAVKRKAATTRPAAAAAA